MYSYNGIGEISITLCDGGMKTGEVCKISDSHTGAGCEAGDEFHGVCRWKKGESATVQVKGFVTQGYTGTAPTVGICPLVADGAGGVKAEADATDHTGYLVVAVDDVQKTVTFLL